LRAMSFPFSFQILYTICSGEVEANKPRTCTLWDVQNNIDGCISS